MFSENHDGKTIACALTLTALFLIAAPLTRATELSEEDAGAPLEITSFQNRNDDPKPATFTIIGMVRDGTRQGVNGVRVLITDENFQPIHTSFVDTGGRFTLKGVRQGRFIVKIDTTGTQYAEASQNLELQSIRQFGGNEDILVEFILKPKLNERTKPSTEAVFAQEIPKSARKEFERGVSNLKGNKSDIAIASFKKAIEIFPDYFDALELLGTEYVKNALYDDAVRTLALAVEVNKHSFKSQYGLGVAHLKSNHLPEAIEWLEKAVQLESNNPNAQMMLGLAYGTGGAFSKSEAVFKKTIELAGPAAAEAHFYLAGLYNKLERYDAARQELEIYLKEAKNLKDPAQIKTMIEKLKEKERHPSINTDSSPSVASASPTTQNTGPLDATDAERNEKTRALEETILLKPITALSPESLKLMRQSELNGAAMHRQLLEFTYQLKKTRRILDEHGKSTHTQEQIFEAYPIRGQHVLVRLSTDGKPSLTVANDRNRAVKELEEAEKLRREANQSDGAAQNDSNGYISAGVSGVYGGKAGYVSINLLAILEACEFFSPRIETIDQRSMTALSFRPRSGLQLPKHFEYIRRLVGAIWIDQTDQVITRLEAWPASEAAFDFIQSTAPRADAALVYQQERQANGLWVPKIISMNANGRKEIFDGLNWEVIFEFSQYQRFNTSADEKLSTPSEKQPR